MILNLFLALGFYALVILIAEASFKSGLDSFTTRKAAHICCGLITASLPAYLTLPYAIIAGLLLSLFVYISKSFHIFKGIEHSDQLSWGTLYFPLGFVLSALIFWNTNPWIFSGSALVLGLSDGMAALIGKHFGNKKIGNSNKSYLGSTVFAAVMIVVCIFVFREIHGSLLEFNVLKLMLAVLGSVIVAGIEALSKDGTDNLFIPLGAGIVLFLIV